MLIDNKFYLQDSCNRFTCFRICKVDSLVVLTNPFAFIEDRGYRGNTLKKGTMNETTTLLLSAYDSITLIPRRKISNSRETKTSSFPKKDPLLYKIMSSLCSFCSTKYLYVSYFLWSPFLLYLNLLLSSEGLT